MDDDEDLDAPDSSVKYKRPATHAEKGAADLERVTDYFEEKELSVDLSSLKAVSVESEIEKKMQKERQLLRVKVKSEDIEIIVRYFKAYILACASYFYLLHRRLSNIFVIISYLYA
ncbi:unnamed protein product [Protopolystoma xenopodis]|uniref:Uncharacterized protein n=1 Tax=Protopolystoma xenopodis TaxID=117903 RepID=A0A3S5FEQ3_9PLAT|nr:unnamed protein product [Protopolystoma xenopodis]